ncbi:MAG TPA: hypothetical protein VL860_10765, partial [Planctomycetota bacterium]|nr:hypothetical protein [Planctomycetota bacterium]
PSYKPEETRWGNGSVFYPGAKLPDVGLPAIDGPLSDLRMKAYRRGLQDYEYCWLLKQAGKEAFADAAIKKVIPLALTEANKPRTAEEMAEEQKNEAAGGKQKKAAAQPAAWSNDVNDWYAMRESLAAELEKK